MDAQGMAGGSSGPTPALQDDGSFKAKQTDPKSLQGFLLLPQFKGL